MSARLRPIPLEVTSHLFLAQSPVRRNEWYDYLSEAHGEFDARVFAIIDDVDAPATVALFLCESTIGIIRLRVTTDELAWELRPYMGLEALLARLMPACGGRCRFLDYPDTFVQGSVAPESEAEP